MKTTWYCAGAAAVLSLLGLSGCTAAESQVDVTPDPSGGGAAGSAGEGGGTSAPEGGSPALRIPVRAIPTATTSDTSLNPTETVSNGVWAPGPSDGAGDPENDADAGADGGTGTETTTATDTIPSPGQTSTGVGTGAGAGGATPSPDADHQPTIAPPDPGDPPAGSEPTISPGSGASPAPLAPEDVCPGRPFTLLPSTVVDIYGSLIGMHDDLTTSCADVFTEPKNRDVVFQMELPEAETLRVTLASTQFLPALSIRHASCFDERTGDACLSPRTIQLDATFSLEAGRHWIVVDSADGETGNFWLQIEASLPGGDD